MPEYQIIYQFSRFIKFLTVFQCSIAYPSSLCLFTGGFPSGSVVKNLPDNAGDIDSVSGFGRSYGGGNSNLLHGQME